MKMFTVDMQQSSGNRELELTGKSMRLDQISKVKKGKGGTRRKGKLDLIRIITFMRSSSKIYLESMYYVFNIV